MTDGPFASILIPTYNHERYIGAALDSVLAQTDQSWEAIVVDDGSTDGSGAIIDRYAARDSRIKAVHKPNGGVASALNAGLSQARGQWVHWLSSDDLFEPTKLAINRQWIEHNPGVNFFYSYFWLLHEATGRREKHKLWGPEPRKGLEIPTLFYRNYISGITVCINRKAWDRAGFFDERYHYAQDYAMWLRLLRDNDSCLVPEWTVVNRHHKEQGSELFPEACYYDTAKAGIDFLNRHSLSEFVPQALLSDPDAAAAIIESVLDVCFDRTAFLYSLGANPALILRLLEWLSGGGSGTDTTQLREKVHDRIRAVALEVGEDDWHWMWRELAAACAEPDPKFVYHPIGVSELAQREHARRRQGVGGPAEPLEVYLRRFEGVDVCREAPAGSSAARVVLFVPGIEPALQSARSAALTLSERGLRTALVVAGHSYRWEPAVTILPRPLIDRDGFPWLGPVELALALDRRPVSIWLEASETAAIGGSDVLDSARITAEVLKSLGLDETRRRKRPVLFLQRVLWGGGAERVVHDLVCRMDKQRFRPIILTLFDAREQANLVDGIETYCVRDYANGPSHSVLRPLVPVGSDQVLSRSPSWKGRLVLVAIRAYFRVVPNWLDKRVGIGIRLVHIHDGLLAGVSVGHYARAAWRKIRRIIRSKNSTVRSPKPSTPVVANQDASNAPVATGRKMALEASLAAHSSAAAGLRHLVSSFGDGAALITIMEEAAAAAWFAQIGGKIPFIASLHTYESMYLPLMYPQPPRCDVESWILANACSAASRVVSPSQACCGDLIRHFDVDQDKTTALPNPVNCSRIRRLSWVPPLREDAALIDDVPYFIHIARLDASKNHDLLVQACRKLKEIRCDFRVVCVGDGPEQLRINGLIASSGLKRHVVLTGARLNPYSLMRRAVALVLTSNFEAFALVLAEAMACGVPAIATACPGGPQELLQAGKSGLLVPVDDPSALALAMDRVMSDQLLRSDLISAGHKRVEDFDISRISQQWEELIDSTLPLPPASGIHRIEASRQ